MPVIRDEFEDSILQNDYEQESSIFSGDTASSVQHLQKWLSCACLETCCGGCISSLLEGDIRRTVANLQAYSSKDQRRADWVRQIQKKSLVKVEKGDLIAIKKARDKKNKDRKWETMDFLRKKYNMKTSKPKLKTKNAQQSEAIVASRRRGMVDPLDLPKDFGTLQYDPEKNLDFILKGTDLTPHVLSNLIDNKSNPPDKKIGVEFNMKRRLTRKGLGTTKSVPSFTTVPSSHSKMPSVTHFSDNASRHSSKIRRERGLSMVTKKSNTNNSPAPTIYSSLKSGTSTTHTSHSTRFLSGFWTSVHDGHRGDLEDLHEVVSTASKRRSSSASSVDSRMTDEQKKIYIKNISENVISALETNWDVNMNYVKEWLKVHNAQKFALADRRTLDRWMVVFYTSSEPMDEFNEFSCLFIRALFMEYRISFDERDINSKKSQHKDDLKKRMAGRQLDVPFVFVDNHKLGGARIIWTIHRLEKMKEVFGRYMMDRFSYSSWIYRPLIIKTDLQINIPLTDFPALELITKGHKVKLKPETMKTIKEGKEIIKVAKQTWKDELSMDHTQPRLTRFTLIRATVKMSFLVMDEAFWRVFFPEQNYPTDAESRRKGITRVPGYVPPVKPAVKVKGSGSGENLREPVD